MWRAVARSASTVLSGGTKPSADAARATSRREAGMTVACFTMNTTTMGHHQDAEDHQGE